MISHPYKAPEEMFCHMSNVTGVTLLEVLCLYFNLNFLGIQMLVPSIF